MMVGAMYGVAFGLLASLTRMRGMALVAPAVAWGGLVFVISSFVGLPLAAVEHLIFGLFLGLILVMGAKRAR